MVAGARQTGQVEVIVAKAAFCGYRRGTSTSVDAHDGSKRLYEYSTCLYARERRTD